jgi:peptidoglycan biosynthesis protein MviN/MurJ (putative lipid II flippase)
MVVTYRHVSPRWKLVAQLATLFTSAGIGLYLIVISQEHDPRLSQIEQVMSGKIWGYVLLVAGLIGLITEILNNWLPGERFFWLVSLCHTILFGVLVAFAASATVGVVTHDSKLWASVLLAGYLGLMNFIYVQRKGSNSASSQP